MADKLDRVMLVVFTYLDQRLTAHASLPPEAILETPMAGRAAAAAAAVAAADDVERRGDVADIDDTNSSSRKGRRSSIGGPQGMEPVARLLKVRLPTVLCRVVLCCCDPLPPLRPVLIRLRIGFLLLHRDECR